MKKMKKALMSLVFAMFVFGIANAQVPAELLNWQIGFRPGIYFYIGDLGSGMGFAGEGYLERKFAEKVSLQGTMAFGIVSSDGKTLKAGATDLKVPGATLSKDATINFKSTIFELLLHGKYYIQRDNISPYVSLGLGMMFFGTQIAPDGKTYQGPGGWHSDPKSQEGSSLYNDGVPIGTIQIPIGLGVNYKLNENFDLLASFSFKFTTTDNIDAATPLSGIYSVDAYSDAKTTDYSLNDYRIISNERRKLGESSGDDKFMMFNVGVAYKFYNPPTDEEKKTEEGK